MRRTASAPSSVAAELVKKLGSQAEVARELAYRLYTLCERKKRAQEAPPPADDGQMAMFGQD